MCKFYKPEKISDFQKSSIEQVILIANTDITQYHRARAF